MGLPDVPPIRPALSCSQVLIEEVHTRNVLGQSLESLPMCPRRLSYFFSHPRVQPQVKDLINLYNIKSDQT